MEESKTFTLTLAESGENHVGMEQLGTRGAPGSGWKLGDLERAQTYFEGRGRPTQLYQLNNWTGMEVAGEDAFILVVRKAFSDAGCAAIKTELEALTWDTKYWDTRRKRVLNKHARQNVMWGEVAQVPDYENGKGTIAAWSDAPQVTGVRDLLGNAVGTTPTELICEGNYYHKKGTGIGYHGDTERRKVAALRIGGSMRLCYQWFHRNKPIGERFDLILENGDAYYMSEKSVGCDWKRSSIPTLRHAAGADKYVVYKPRK